MDEETSRSKETGSPRRRGVRRGVKRGKYWRSPNEDAKRRIIDAANGGEDWRNIAKANGVSTSTAYGWIKRSEEPEKRRGGARVTNMTEETVEKAIGYVANNPLISLKEIQEKLRVEENVSVSTTTIHNKLDMRFYTIKKVLNEPSTMNSAKRIKQR